MRTFIGPVSAVNQKNKYFFTTKIQRTFIVGRSKVYSSEPEYIGNITPYPLVNNFHEQFLHIKIIKNNLRFCICESMLLFGKIARTFFLFFCNCFLPCQLNPLLSLASYFIHDYKPFSRAKALRKAKFFNGTTTLNILYCNIS